MNYRCDKKMQLLNLFNTERQWFVPFAESNPNSLLSTSFQFRKFILRLLPASHEIPWQQSLQKTQALHRH